MVVISFWYFVSENNTQDAASFTKTGFFSQAVDENTPLGKSSEIVELSDGDMYEMVASIVKQEVGNRTIKRLAYNGQIPGPLLKVEKDSTITLKLTNNLDVETTLHPHGLRLNNAFDGVPDVTQEPIKVGESFIYQLMFPDEGVYWYHPHIREDYTQELGLYGNFLVESKEKDYWNTVDREEFLILDDVLEKGKFERDIITHTLMGRFGDVLLINDEENYTLNVDQGTSVRFYLTNVANTRTFDFEVPDVRMKLVGGDSGRIEKEVFINNQIIAPSERYVIEVLFEKPGTYPIQHRGKTMGNIVVSEGVAATIEKQNGFNSLRINSEYQDFRRSLPKLIEQVPDKELRLDISMGSQMHQEMMQMEMNMMNPTNDDMMREHCEMMPEMSGCEQYTVTPPHSMRTMKGHEDDADGIEWEDDMPMMNQISTDESVTWKLVDEKTGEENMDINWSFTQGELVKVRIHNDPNTMHPMQHPIHFHGQRFIVLSENGVTNNNLQWKDTVLVPKGKTVDLLVEMSNPGVWMAHCHIAEHLHAGMMLSFEVVSE